MPDEQPSIVDEPIEASASEAPTLPPEVDMDETAEMSHSDDVSVEGANDRVDIPDAPDEGEDDPWLADLEADEETEEPEVLKLEADPPESQTAPQDEKAKATEEEAEDPSTEEGWWTFEEEADKRKVIKLKADASPQSETSAKEEEKPETETLWTAES